MYNSYKIQCKGIPALGLLGLGAGQYTLYGLPYDQTPAGGGVYSHIVTFYHYQ